MPDQQLLRKRKRMEWTHQPLDVVVTDMEEINSDDKYSVMPPLIYPEDSGNEKDNPHESLSNPPFADPNLEPGPPNEKPI